jgi:hypothetical protein
MDTASAGREVAAPPVRPARCSAPDLFGNRAKRARLAAAAGHWPWHGSCRPGKQKAALTVSPSGHAGRFGFRPGPGPVPAGRPASGYPRKETHVSERAH